MNITNLSDLLDIFYTPFMWLLNGVIYVLGYAVYYPFDGVLTVFSTALTALDFSSIAFNFLGQIAGLPPQLMYLLNAVSFPAALTIVSGAYILRLAMNLIPAAFTRI